MSVAKEVINRTRNTDLSNPKHLNTLESLIGKGKTTGDTVLDYLIVDYKIGKSLIERWKNIQAIKERISNNVGEELLVHWRGTWYTGHSQKYGMTGGYPYDQIHLLQIESEDLNVKVSKNPKIKGIPRWRRFLAELLIPVSGYADYDSRMHVHSSIKWKNGDMEFPEHAGTLAVGDDEVLVWRKSNPRHEKWYQEMKEVLQTGLKAA